jgi:uncharacterized protein YndB with AHSA1/START domain
MNQARYDPLDPVLRVRVLAAALTGSVVAERILEATFEQVWRVVTDLETMGPRYETNVTAIQFIQRSPTRDRIVATLRGGHDEEMDVRIVPGWCLMQSLSFVVAFGARSAGPHTLLAHLEHSRTAASVPTGEHMNRAQETLALELNTIESLAANLPSQR